MGDDRKEVDLKHITGFSGKQWATDEQDLRPMDRITDDLFAGKDIPEHEFQFFQANVGSGDSLKYLFINSPPNALKIWERKYSKKEVSDVLSERFIQVVTCYLELLPLYINYPFTEIIDYRLRHNI